MESDSRRKELEVRIRELESGILPLVGKVPSRFKNEVYVKDPETGQRCVYVGRVTYLHLNEYHRLKGIYRLERYNIETVVNKKKNEPAKSVEKRCRVWKTRTEVGTTQTILDESGRLSNIPREDLKKWAAIRNVVLTDRLLNEVFKTMEDEIVKGYGAIIKNRYR